MSVSWTNTEVVKFLGMITYLSKYVPNLAHISETSRVFIPSDQTFNWLKLHEDSFNDIKELIGKEIRIRLLLRSLRSTIPIKLIKIKPRVIDHVQENISDRKIFRQDILT